MPDPDHAATTAPDKAASSKPFGYPGDNRQLVAVANEIAAPPAPGEPSA